MSNEYASRRAWRVGLVLLPLILIPFVAVGASGGGSSPTFQTGVVQCNIAAANLPQIPAGCTGTITFPKAFTNIPTAYHVNVGCEANAAANLVTQNLTAICSGITSAGLVTGPISTYNIPIVAANQTLNRWPVHLATLCVTQPGGTNTNCDVAATANLWGINPIMALSVTCVTGGFTGNEWMGVQFSLDGGSTWTTTGINDTDIGGLCPLIPALAEVTTGASMPNGLNSPIEFRLIGGGGTGATNDNIEFSNIHLEISWEFSEYIISGVGLPGGGANLITKTSMTFYAYSFQRQVIWVIMSWDACSGC